MNTLYAWNVRGISLEEALGQCSSLWQGAAPVALVYTPQRCALLRVIPDGNTERLGAEPGNVVPASIFEARVFCDAGELRWQHAGSGFRAAFVSESPSAPSGTWAEAPLQYVGDPLQGHYVLFGEGLTRQAEAASEWSRIGDARIGGWSVPISGVRERQAVTLHYREYLGLAPGPSGAVHGNVCSIEQRLIGLRHA